MPDFGDECACAQCRANVPGPRDFPETGPPKMGAPWAYKDATGCALEVFYLGGWAVLSLRGFLSLPSADDLIFLPEEKVKELAAHLSSYSAPR